MSTVLKYLNVYSEKVKKISIFEVMASTHMIIVA